MPSGEPCAHCCPQPPPFPPLTDAGPGRGSSGRRRQLGGPGRDCGQGGELGAGDWCRGLVPGIGAICPPNLCMPSTFLPPPPFQLSANLSSLVTRLSKMLHDESEIKEGIDGKVKVSAAVFLQAMDARVQERLPDSTPHM